MQRLESKIRAIPGFPEPGVVFRDITPLVGDPAMLRLAVHQLVHPFIGEDIDAVAGMEARGFIFGVLAAQELNVGFVPLRKPGKLPYDVQSVLLRAGIRHGIPGSPHRRHQSGGSHPARGRSHRYRGYCVGKLQAHRAARRRDCGLRVRDRARRSRGAGEVAGPPGTFAAALLRSRVDRIIGRARVPASTCRRPGESTGRERDVRSTRAGGIVVARSTRQVRERRGRAS